MCLTLFNQVFPNSPLAWAAVREVALEVAEITPAIAGGKTPTQPVISGNKSRVDAASWAGHTEPGVAYECLLLCLNSDAFVNSVFLHTHSPFESQWNDCNSH